MVKLQNVLNIALLEQQINAYIFELNFVLVNRYKMGKNQKRGPPTSIPE